MGGVQIRVAEEPGSDPSVTLPGRVASLEGRMFQVEQGLGDVRTVALAANRNAAEAAANTRELLAIANATKGAIGFAKKHGPKLISFGCGVMTILGFGNPELWKYVSGFFGH